MVSIPAAFAITNQTTIYLADTKSRCIDTSGIPVSAYFLSRKETNVCPITKRN